MRLVFPVLLLLLGVFLVYFGITNPGERVTVTLLSTPYPEVPLFIVVLISLAVGVAFTAVVALIEGATIRVGNRRLRKEMQRLETEATFLRTEPRPSRPELGDVVAAPAPPMRRPEPRDEIERASLPSAPVYDPESNEPQG